MNLSVRREPLLLVVVLAVVGLLFVRSSSEPPPLRGRRAIERLEAASFPPPDLGRLEFDGAPLAVGGRDLFAEPSDTRPLPPLEWRAPELPELAALFPPPVPGPAPDHYGRLLRRAPVRLEGEASQLPEFDSPEPPGSSDVLGILETLGREPGDDPDALSPDERAARRAQWRRRYDWVQLDGALTLWGSIENRDRYGLFGSGRDEEAILLVEVDPATGREAFPGQGPIAYPRERVTDFRLADNRANELELRVRALRVSAGTSREVLRFADDCLAYRHEAPRALELARGVLAELAALDPDDPSPRIALARCHEAAFELDAAFAEYRSLLERFPHRSEVRVALAELELACLLVDSAEARLREALRVDRTSWRAHRVLGRLLLDRGEGGEALEHLEAANRFAPSVGQSLEARLGLRYDLAAAHLWQGEPAAAERELAQALRLDPAHQPSIAARIGCALLDPGIHDLPRPTAEDPEAALAVWLAPVANANDEDGGEGLGFELLLALGLWNLEHGDADGARTRLRAAEASDSLRAHLARRALSVLAEREGRTDEALRHVEAALDGDPRDPWSHFQRGRLLAGVDDLEGARESFDAALERDLDFDDALVAIGELLFRTGDDRSAARYLERALVREPDRVVVHTLLGLARLSDGAFREANQAFEGALQLDPTDPVAAGGRAWCTYRLGNAAEALVALAELDDSRRDLPEDDGYREWAREQIERLTEHLSKVAWGDGFARTSLRNGWQVEEGSGPLVELANEVVHLRGGFTRAGAVRVFREYPASAFVAFEASLWVPSTSSVRTGLFVARERRRQRTWQTDSEVAVARHRDGATEVRLQASASDEPEVLLTEELPFPTDRWVRLRIERGGTESRPEVSIYLDEVPVVLAAPFGQLGRGSQPLRLGVFAEGEVGRTVDVRVDDAVVVYREPAQ